VFCFGYPSITVQHISISQQNCYNIETPHQVCKQTAGIFCKRHSGGVTTDHTASPQCHPVGFRKAAHRLRVRPTRAQTCQGPAALFLGAVMPEANTEDLASFSPLGPFQIQQFLVYTGSVF